MELVVGNDLLKLFWLLVYDLLLSANRCTVCINHGNHSGLQNARIGKITAPFFCHIRFFLQWLRKNYDMQQKKLVNCMSFNYLNLLCLYHLRVKMKSFNTVFSLQ